MNPTTVNECRDQVYICSLDTDIDLGSDEEYTTS